MYTCTKKFSDFPFAHRQPAHPGHCQLIHGHNWAFEFTFACKELEPGTGFVIDFGDLKWLKKWLADHFDHTLVLNVEDPFIDYFVKVLLYPWLLATESAIDKPFARIVKVPNCGAEGLACYIYECINIELHSRYDGRVFLASVTVEEDSKNSATYRP